MRFILQNKLISEYLEEVEYKKNSLKMIVDKLDAFLKMKLIRIREEWLHTKITEQ